MNFFTRVIYTTPEKTIQNVKKAVLNHTVVHLAGFREDQPLHDFYSRLSETMGRIHAADEDLTTGKPTGNRWIDITYDPNVPDRYRSSNTRQPLHTDDSYVELYGEEAVNFFYCASRAKIGGATIFFSLAELIECMELDGQQDLLAELMATDVVHEKGGSRKVRKIIDRDAAGYLVNYNYYCISKAENSPGVLALVERFQHFLETRIHNAGLARPVQLQKGEAVFFHDDRVLHGRNAFFASYPGQRSLIKGKIIMTPAAEMVYAVR